MTLIDRFCRAQASHPTWTYGELAKFLKCSPDTLRGMNYKLKLPVPRRAKLPDGQTKRRNPKSPKSIPEKSFTNQVVSRTGTRQTGYIKLM